MSRRERAARHVENVAEEDQDWLHRHRDHAWHEQLAALSPAPSAAPSESAQMDIKRSVDSILQFWFSHGRSTPQSALHRNVWMSQDPSKQAAVDRAVHDNFGRVLSRLYGDANYRELWFRKDFDAAAVHPSTHNDVVRSHVAGIVVLDQFPRHIHRLYSSDGEMSSSCTQTEQGQKIDIGSVEDTDALALAVAEGFLADDDYDDGDGDDDDDDDDDGEVKGRAGDEKRDDGSGGAGEFFPAPRLSIEDNSLTLPMKVFSLMPLRHSKRVELLRKVTKIIDKWDANLEGGDKKLLGRFRKASGRRLQGLQDMERHLGIDRIESVAEGSGSSKRFDDDEILEVFEFEGDLSDVQSNPLYKTMEDFVVRVCLNVGDQDGFKPCETAKKKEVKKRQEARKKVKQALKSSSEVTPIAVSLSGGVDSMVIAHILTLLRSHYPIRIIGIHIDYANRPESSSESDYVRRWCLKHDIFFVERVVSEVTRGVTARNDYEKIARDIRYGTYLKVMATHKVKGVLFGHHQGDVQENVISNSMKGKSPLDLSGMGEVGVVNTVNVWRPLVSHVKEEIFAYSHKYGVPYFKDTTPSWSTRGKMRNELIPLLQEMFGEGVLGVLSKLGNASDEAMELVNDTVITPFVNSVSKTSVGCHVNTKTFKDRSIFFWSTCMQNLLHSMGLPMLSNKSLVNFLTHISRKNAGGKWLEVSQK